MPVEAGLEGEEPVFGDVLPAGCVAGVVDGVLGVAGDAADGDACDGSSFPGPQLIEANIAEAAAAVNPSAVIRWMN